tara:strand:- start:927 stop:1976 length:1050 start_codon:yes stop_codon:yes gene_type:complete
MDYLDFFGGAGGWASGFTEAGWKASGFYEINEAACATASHNLGKEITPTDITSLPMTKIPSCKIIIGSPPCQGFSNEGKKDPSDVRNTLVRNYLDVIKNKKPEVFVFENVPGFSRLYGGKFEAYLRTFASENGYHLNSKILDLSQFGVPQVRKRYIAIGCRSKAIPLPNGNFIESSDLFSDQNKITLWEAISDLPTVEHNERSGEFAYDKPPTNDYQVKMRAGSEAVHNHTTQKHSDRVLTKIRSVPAGGGMRQIVEKFDENKTKYEGGYRRALKDRPSYTAYWTRGMTSIHPVQDRFLSPRECARIQSFPDKHIFLGTTIENYTLICNAVPPVFARCMAEHLEAVTPH